MGKTVLTMMTKGLRTFAASTASLLTEIFSSPEFVTRSARFEMTINEYPTILNTRRSVVDLRVVFLVCMKREALASVPRANNPGYGCFAFNHFCTMM